MKIQKVQKSNEKLRECFIKLFRISTFFSNKCLQIDHFTYNSIKKKSVYEQGGLESGLSYTSPVRRNRPKLQQLV